MAKWYFEHDDLSCPKCRENGKESTLNFFLGTYRNKEAHKYVCTDKECKYKEIKTLDEL